MFSKIWRFFGLCFLGAVCLTQAANLYVSPTGSGTAPYNEWGKATPDIQTAVDQAEAGDTIWISNGVYKLDDTISVDKNLNIYGNPGEVITIDGQGSVRCITAADTANACNFSNLTIINGKASAGGGMLFYGGTIVDCVFSNNLADGNAGALDVSGSSALTIEGCQFVENTSAGNGGAINSTSTTSEALITDCLFSDNQAGAEGGGLYNTGKNLNLKNNNFESNTAAKEGGAIRNSGSGVIYENCNIINNTTELTGGGINNSGSGSLIENCNIISNTAESNGGGIWLTSGITINKCLIKHNLSNPTSGNAGGGGMFVSSSGRPLVQNCIFTENTAANRGGGIYASASSTADSIYRNCLIYNNQAATYGGGMHLYSGKPILINCTIVKNRGNTGGGISSFEGDAYIFTSINSIVYFNTKVDGITENNFSPLNSDVQFLHNCSPTDLNTLYPRSAGNITDEPDFTNFAEEDFRLVADSPCINLGLKEDWMENIPDLDGRPRLDRFSGLVDLGCYEFMPAGVMFKLR